MTESAAYGEISVQQDYLEDLKLARSDVIIMVKQVVIPAAIIARHKKPLGDFGKVPFQVVVKLSDLRTYKKIDVCTNNTSVIQEEQVEGI
jgi:hypothetical protein